MRTGRAQRRDNKRRGNRKKKAEIAAHHEDVIRVRQLTSRFEELHHIIELAVDITADGDGARDGLYVRLFQQELLDLSTEKP